MGQSYGSATYGLVPALIEEGGNFASTVDLNNEATIRANNDNSEAGTRSNNDSAETAARIAGDNALAAAIANEATDRNSVDVALSNAINAEITNRTNALAKDNLLSILGATQLTGSNSGDETQTSIVNKLGYTPANTSHTHAHLVNGSGWASVDTSGNLTASGDVVGFSDIRLKSDIRKIEGALDKLSTLGGYLYLRNDLNKYQNGTIAQEVQKVLPDSVMVDSETGFLKIANSGLIALLVEAVNELNLKVDALSK